MSFFPDFWRKSEKLISGSIFIELKKILFCQKHVSLNILCYNCMILGLKHNTLAPGQIDSPPRVTRVILTRRDTKGGVSVVK